MRPPGTTMATLLKEKLIAVVRLDDGSAICDVTAALIAGGVGCIEVTMTVPNAIECIEFLRTCSDVRAVGAGTVLTAAEAARCIDAGADFIVSPAFVPEVVRKTKELGATAIPGALTPTEVVNCWNAGADIVKIFPAARVGAAFIADLKGPFPHLKLVPTGGITAENVAEYIKAGADVVCAGSWLVSEHDVLNCNFSEIERKARNIVRVVRGCTT